MGEPTMSVRQREARIAADRVSMLTAANVAYPVAVLCSAMVQLISGHAITDSPLLSILAFLWSCLWTGATPVFVGAVIWLHGKDSRVWPLIVNGLVLLLWIGVVLLVMPGVLASCRGGAA